MKISISTKSLKIILGNIDFKSESVQDVRIDNGSLLITTDKKQLEVIGEVFEEYNLVINQTGVHWDWLYELCMAVKEQSATLIIDKDRLRIVFEF